jgi:catechol 2,3-dioxygenase-like lactoylglutathione lyase family enzyme
MPVSYAVVFVSDMPAAVSFYRDALGLPLVALGGVEREHRVDRGARVGGEQQQRLRSGTVPDGGHGAELDARERILPHVTLDP